VLQIIVQGRGGQGAQTAGNLLAAAFHREGRHIQSFSTYGGARRGTPVSSFIRVDDRPVRLRCDIERADALLCFDSSLLTAALLERAARGALIVVNAGRAPEEWSRRDDVRILPIDGMAIARKHGLGRIVNSCLLGAFVCALGEPSIEVMQQTIAEAAPTRKAENAGACRDAYECTRLLLEEALECQ
jgi:pyruvate ferredoxin oxidoreductase gamma subunit